MALQWRISICYPPERLHSVEAWIATMALIQDSIGRTDESSGYGRVFGNNQLGKLISRVHVCAIRNGNELEKLLWDATPHKSTADNILGSTFHHASSPIHVVTGQIVRKSLRDAPLTDFLVLNRQTDELSVIELKDGDTFDTKKADGELASAKKCAEWMRQRVRYSVRYYFCAFNQTNKKAIVTGIKERFTVEQVLTGREFCERIGVDYDAMCTYRQGHQEANREYFVSQLFAIPEIRDLIEQYLKQK
jgi:hypothetical protein